MSRNLTSAYFKATIEQIKVVKKNKRQKSGGFF